ncbi:MAG: BON domain-containing protein [Bacillota bacterium]
MNIFGSKYDDDRLKKIAKSVFEESPILRRNPNINIVSENGRITIFGSVKSQKIKEDIKEAVQEKLNTKNLNYDVIINELSTK